VLHCIQNGVWEPSRMTTERRIGGPQTRSDPFAGAWLWTQLGPWNLVSHGDGQERMFTNVHTRANHKERRGCAAEAEQATLCGIVAAFQQIRLL
jgi:hypothetical protein